MNHQKLLKTIFPLLAMLLFAFQIQAQTISGKVLDAEDNQGLIGASVLVKGTSTGTVTDIDGNFSLAVSQLPTDILVTYTGYADQTITVTSANEPITVNLAVGLRLDEVVVTGSRGKPRTILTSPVPIDNLNAADLKASGQKSVNQMINFKVPSFSSTPQTISDASAHFDPSELRNLGPSRTLVLINGKRKNQSAQVYLNRTPGRGEVGTDFKSFPAGAIERIEVLRDGASAQYGSDAVAGVINIILKERVNETQINLETGITYRGDGYNYAADINHGFNIGKNGFLNLTGDIYHTNRTNRAGTPQGDGLFGFLYSIDAIPLAAAGPEIATPGVLATAEQIRDGDTDWLRANPDLGMIIGIPEQSRYSGFANFGLPYAGGEFYASGGYTFRYGKSFALYRAPYWPGVGSERENNPLYVDRTEEFQGFQPTFESDIQDITFTVGNKFFFNDWTLDLSLTNGSNDVQYLVSNSVNVGLGMDSPTEVDPGGYRFGNTLGNVDLFRQFGDLSFSAGVEVRNENFESRAGEEASYISGGIQSFPGLQPSNELDESRTNTGVYAGLDYDVSASFLVGAAVRYENYSSIGDGDNRSNFSWKINARQILGDNRGAIRASVSTGFRAPSLHQIFLSNIQTLLVGNEVAQQGTFNNVSDVTRNLLQVPQLDVETSFNFTAGITYKLTNNLSATIDYYNISVDDRVLLTNQISTGALPDGNSVRADLEGDGVESFVFFTNAADTETQGIDLVLNLDNVRTGSKGSLGFTAALNWNDIDVDTEGITVPPVFADNNIDIFGREEVGRIETGRPNLKALIGISYKIGGLSFNFNNTYFGEVSEIHPTDPSLDQVFAGKVLTDLIIGYQINDKVNINFTANNLFDVFPDELRNGDADFNVNLGGRFKYPWHVNQFGFTGGLVKIGATINL